MKQKSQNKKSKHAVSKSKAVQNTSNNNKSSPVSFKGFLSDNIVIISLLQLICSVLTFFIPVPGRSVIDQVIPPITSFVVELDTVDNFKEIERVKNDIKAEVDLIEKSIKNNEITRTNDKNHHNINSFNKSLLDLISYQGVHEKSEFNSNSLQESCILAEANVTDRFNFDSYLRVVLSRMKELHKLNYIKHDSMLLVSNGLIENQAIEWLTTDSLRNCFMKGLLKLGQMKNDSDFYLKAMEPMKEFKSNPMNYYFQKNFYIEMNRIHRKIKN